MESKYVHTPAVAPEHRSEEARDLPEPPETTDVRTMLQRVEEQVRAHPGYFVAGGFAVGVILGILVRR